MSDLAQRLRAEPEWFSNAHEAADRIEALEPLAQQAANLQITTVQQQQRTESLEAALREFLECGFYLVL